MGFAQTTSDRCLYISTGEMFVIAVYVDIVLAGKSDRNMSEVKCPVHASIKCSDPCLCAKKPICSAIYSGLPCLTCARVAGVWSSLRQCKVVVLRGFRSPSSGQQPLHLNVVGAGTEGSQNILM